ncbi:TPA_asm: hypothetical protein G0B48_03995 [Salmonella enterica subsp. indica]|uniref:Uncharacterized protein n=1 Tax=Salmonella enterica TaxID=28901 RepID=A0A702E3D1_SALER|nr:hypothetical protein [Salmonella enterica subsp. indica]EEJ9032690.1 hypothetical protein [Salmonella enterica subsp. enterica serovar Oslo]HAC6564388.1 hypothetical protein [Salmonella enterica subsp. indica]
MATLLTKRRHLYFNVKIKRISLKLKIIVTTLNTCITRQLFFITPRAVKSMIPAHGRCLDKD